MKAKSSAGTTKCVQLQWVDDCNVQVNTDETELLVSWSDQR